MGSVPPEALCTNDIKYNQFIKLLKPTGTEEKIAFALFGAGRAGTIHLGNLLANPRVQLKYVIEERAERIAEIKKLVGSDSLTKVVGIDQIDAVLKDNSVQAVAITTPTDSHKDIVLKSLESGKAVFCEKPLANNYDDVKKCYQLAKKNGLPLLCAFNRRFDPAFSALAKRAHVGEVGKIHVVKTCARDSPLPSMEYLKISNAIFHDCAVHDIDLCCYVMGEFPTRVFSSATAHRKEIAEINDFDTVTIQMTFPGGGMSLTDLSRFAIYGYDQRLEVFGPGGMIQCKNQHQLDVQTFTKDGVKEEPIYYSFPSRYNDAYKMQLDHFINVILGKEKIMVTEEETLACCRIASAAEKSARTGLPVDVKYD